MECSHALPHHHLLRAGTARGPGVLKIVTQCHTAFHSTTGVPDDMNPWQVDDMSVEIGSIIVRTPEFRGGQPHIAGTGITVHRIVRWYKQGYSPEQIADEYAHLTLAQVYAALSYYHANQADIEAELAAENAEIARLEHESRPASRGA
jgi:uncharacterized protein (DUF433 family)